MPEPPPKRKGLASFLHNRRLQWFALFTYATLLALGSLLPSNRLPKIPNWSDLFSPDKVAHFGAYAILAVLLSAPLYSRYGGKGIPAAVALAAAFGALLEGLQGLTGLGREADPVDMVANLLGAVLGGVIVTAGRQLYKMAFSTENG